MDQNQWKSVDEYFIGKLCKRDSFMDGIIEEAEHEQLPAINVAPNQGKLLYLLALAIGAKRILEIGTLGGYSAVWLARALSPDGKLITLEIDAHHASVARRNIESAGFSTLVEVREGHAIDTLAAMIEEGIESFDLIFIDADKSQYAKYFELALRLTHPGSVILADNVVRGGTVARSDTLDPNTLGIRDFIEAMGASDQVEATAVQTVGLKGYDGFSIAVVRG